MDRNHSGRGAGQSAVDGRHGSLARLGEHGGFGLTILAYALGLVPVDPVQALPPVDISSPAEADDRRRVVSGEAGERLGGHVGGIAEASIRFSFVLQDGVTIKPVCGECFAEALGDETEVFADNNAVCPVRFDGGECE